MIRRSPPKHRHDGASPLPLGMDWSPPPKKWDGRDTVWPHDHRTGWSYCVTVPSWVSSPDSKAFDGNLVNPIVFYRVQVGIQSPEGITAVWTVLRRFSDFLKLFTTLTRIFPRKALPPPPPKHSFLRVNSSRMQLEERRSALDGWMNKLLSDIDISRCNFVASFLDLEAAARSFFAESSSVISQAQPTPPNYVSNSTYEAYDFGIPRKTVNDSSETGMVDSLSDHDLAVPVREVTKLTTSIHENGHPNSVADRQEESSILSMGFEKFNGANKNIEYVDPQNNALMEILLERKKVLTGHARKLSSESITSDLSSVRGSELSNTGTSYLVGDSSHEFGLDAEYPHNSGASCNNEVQFLGDVHIVLPLDQRQKLNRVLLSLQRRLASARTDMEDMIARLNQEAAVKEYLTTKVKDLNDELEMFKQKSKENLQQAILGERERITQLQWDMEEVRRKSMELEIKFSVEQDEKDRAQADAADAISERDFLRHELDMTKEQLENILKAHEEQEMKMKADIKVLVKEVKYLRKSQTDLTQELQQSVKAKAELEEIIRIEKIRNEQVRTSRMNLLHECKILHHRLQECSINFLSEEKDKFVVDPSSLSDALGLLATSDNRIDLLLAEAQLISQEDDSSTMSPSRHQVNEESGMGFEFHKMLGDVLIDNARLRKLVNLCNQNRPTVRGRGGYSSSFKADRTPQVPRKMITKSIVANNDACRTHSPASPRHKSYSTNLCMHEKVIYLSFVLGSVFIQYIVLPP